MIDPEVARLRRLRNEALLVREIARTLHSSRWAATESLLNLSACASWRIARVVSGRLRSHPYAEYQKDIGFGSRVRNRMHAYLLGLRGKDHRHALRALAAHLNGLGRQMDDAIALAWSSDFSDALSRSQAEIKMLGAALAQETQENGVPTRPVLRSPRSEVMSGALQTSLDGDWPYLAF